MTLLNLTGKTIRVRRDDGTRDFDIEPSGPAVKAVEDLYPHPQKIGYQNCFTLNSLMYRIVEGNIPERQDDVAVIVDPIVLRTPEAQGRPDVIAPYGPITQPDGTVVYTSFIH